VSDGFGGFNRFLTVPTSDTILPVVCFSSCSPCPPASLVTFRVDLGLLAPDPNGIHIAGNFQGWNPASTPLTFDSTGGFWYLTTSLPEGDSVFYKFVNGNTWGNDEIVPATCGIGAPANRWLVVPTPDTILPVVCFASCSPCPPPPAPVNVTFRVDMSLQSVGPNGVFLTGSFNGWTPIPMTANGSVYSATVPILSGSNIEFKFRNDTSLFENVPSSCGVSDGFGGFNRFLTVPTSDTILPVVCFSSCSPCPPTSLVTFRVDLGLLAPDPNGVHIAGNFQGWNPASTPLTFDSTGGFWYLTTSLPEGDSVFYKFINGNTWGNDEIVPATCGIGAPANRWLVVPASDTVLPVVCFASCSPCPPPPAPVNVTFRVDMSLQSVGPNGVFLTGSFNGWTPIPMTANGSVYSATVPILSGSNIEFKFRNDTSLFENVPSSCGVSDGFGGFNRTLSVPTSDTVLPVVCFSSCSPCPPTSLVTFRVDLGILAPDPNGVHIAGNFQGWNPASTPLTFDSTGGFWYFTTSLPEGDSVFYKFINGNTWGNDENVPPACGIGNPLNRWLVVPTSDTVLPVICFSSCTPCTPLPKTSEVTISVNMKGQSVSPEGVHIAGTFNQWNYSEYKMTQIQPNIYQVALTLDTGAFILYRFSNGNTFINQEIISGTCTMFGNRFLQVPSTDTTLPVVCFGLCDTSCATLSIENFSLDRLKAGFSDDVLFINGLPSGGYPVRITLFDLLGKTIFQINEFSQPVWKRHASLPAAPYLLRIELDGKERNFKLLKIH
jgi:1,4-alpha-glucan branching enzyme